MLQNIFSKTILISWADQLRRWLVQNWWFNQIARWGYLAKGIIYVLVGLLAIQAAFGVGYRSLGLKDALATVSRNPVGPIFLTFVGVGLSCYVVWCIGRALSDIDQHGNGWKGLILRGRYIISGFIFANLTYDALELVIDWSSHEADLTDDWTRTIYSYQIGRILISAVGIIVLLTALYQWYSAWNAKFLKSLDLDDVAQEGRILITQLGRLGYAARGVVFAIMGGFLVFSVIRYNMSQIDDGIGDALVWIAEKTVGPWLLTGVAAGLISYGIYLIVEGRYRRISLSSGL